MVLEILPSDQGINGLILPKDGNHVHVWGSWVTDKPKGWREIHPTWNQIFFTVRTYCNWTYTMR